MKRGQVADVDAPSKRLREPEFPEGGGPPSGVPDGSGEPKGDEVPMASGVILKAQHAEKILPTRTPDQGIKRWELRKMNAVARSVGDPIFILQTGKINGRGCWTSSVKCAWKGCRKINSLDELESNFLMHLTPTREIEDPWAGTLPNNSRFGVVITIEAKTSRYF